MKILILAVLGIGLVTSSKEDSKSISSGCDKFGKNKKVKFLKLLSKSIPAIRFQLISALVL